MDKTELRDSAYCSHGNACCGTHCTCRMIKGLIGNISSIGIGAVIITSFPLYAVPLGGKLITPLDTGPLLPAQNLYITCANDLSKSNCIHCPRHFHSRFRVRPQGDLLPRQSGCIRHQWRSRIKAYRPFSNSCECASMPRQNA